MSSERRGLVPTDQEELRRDVCARLNRLVETIVAQAAAADPAYRRDSSLTVDDHVRAFNSISLLELVMAIEAEFGVEIPDEAIAAAGDYALDDWTRWLVCRLGTQDGAGAS